MPAGVWFSRGMVALLSALVLTAGCGLAPARPLTTGALLHGWLAPGRPGLDPLQPPAPTVASLKDISTYWQENLDIWSLTPGPWRRVGAVGGRVPDRGWSWDAASLAARAGGFGWPAKGAALYRQRVVLRGDPGWTVRPAEITLWAAVAGGTVAAAWLTFRLGARTVATVYNEGPAVFTLPYWSDPAVGLSPAESAVLPAGVFVTAQRPLGGAVRGSVVVTFAEGLAAVEGLLVPAGGARVGAWRFVALGPVGSVLAAAPEAEWGDATGSGGSDLILHYGSGAVVRGLAIYDLRRRGGGWRAVQLFAGDGDMAADVPAPGRGRIVVLGLLDTSGATIAYQTVVWRKGGFRLGPGIDGPVPPAPAAPRAGKARRATSAPDVQGLSVGAAVRRLAARGIGVLPLVPVVSPARAGTVLRQAPPPGTAVGGQPWLGLEVAAGSGLLRAGTPPELSGLRVEDASGVRAAGPAALAAWRRETAWVFAAPLPVIPIVRGPGEMSDGADGRILVLRLARPWRLRLPAPTGTGTRRAGVDTLAFSDAPLYTGWMLLGSKGRWVAAVRLPAGRDRVLRSLVGRLAP